MNKSSHFRKQALAVAITLALGNQKALAAIAPDPVNKLAFPLHTAEAYPYYPSEGRRIGTDGAGLFLSVWSDDNGIHGQYTRNGFLHGSRFLISNQTAGRSLSVSMNPAGAAVVVWLDEAVWPDEANVTAQLIPTNNTADLSSSIVIGSANDSSSVANVAMDETGDFAVVWPEGTSVQMARFDNSGAVTNAAIDVAGDIDRPCSASYLEVAESYRYPQYGYRYGYTTDTLYSGSVPCSPDIAVSPSGQAVVSWDSGTQIFARRYNKASSVSLDSAAIRVDTTPDDEFLGGANFKETFYRAGEPAVAMDDSGNFAIAWNRVSINSSIKFVKRAGCHAASTVRYNGYSYAIPAYCETGDHYENIINDTTDVVTQRFDAAALPASRNRLGVMTDLMVTKNKAPSHSYIPTISMDSTGNFAIAWNHLSVKKMKVCGTYYGRRYCETYEIPLSDSKVRRFSVASGKLKAGALTTLAKGSFKTVSTNNYHLQAAGGPAVALDDLGNLETLWDQVDTAFYLDPYSLSLYGPDPMFTPMAKLYPGKN